MQLQIYQYWWKSGIKCICFVSQVTFMRMIACPGAIHANKLFCTFYKASSYLQRCTTGAQFLLSLTDCDSSYPLVYGVSINLFVLDEIVSLCYLKALLSLFTLLHTLIILLFSLVFFFLDKDCRVQQKMLTWKKKL